MVMVNLNMISWWNEIIYVILHADFIQFVNVTHDNLI